MAKEKKHPQIASRDDWHALSFTKVLDLFGSSIEGLAEEEVKRRLKKFKANVLPQKKAVSRATIFFRQLKSPLIYILLAAAAVSLFFQELVNAYVILAAVALNTAIGYLEENKANRALAKIKDFIQPTALVKRAGENREIAVKELVPGDIIYLQAGNNVPADCRIIEAVDLEINEALLTGEAMPSVKQEEPVIVGAGLIDREAMAYFGTLVVRGRGMAIVTATGHNSEMGKIAKLIGEAEEEITPLQVRLAKLSNQLGLLVAVVAVLIFLIGVLQNRQTLEIFITAVAVAVAAIPEGLPVAVTVILTIGMQRILKKNSLVRKLIAAETLGSTTVICTDKTGTLTEGKMYLANIILSDQRVDIIKEKFEHRDPRYIYFALRIMLHCNDAFLEETDGLGSWKIVGSPTDQAMLSAAIQAGLNYKKEKARYPRLDELPFNSENKFMASLHRVKDPNSVIKAERLILAKGAPEIILDKSRFLHTEKGARQLNKDDRLKFLDELKKLTSSGLRVIALAYRPVTAKEKTVDFAASLSDLVFFGLVTLKDPLRAETAETIELCRSAGIRPVIITGDHWLTGKAIAREIGLKVEAENIIDGEELDKVGDEELAELAGRVNLYARVSPHHKLRIIEALKKKKEVVAMIGDGVNDAPAIKAADIGVALGSGTDVAKETSDMVLLDNNFSTIVAAVEQGRIIFSNIRKVVTYLVSDVFSEIILIVGSIIFNLPLALLPAQILWLNIVNDSLPNFSLAFERAEPGIMSEKPIKGREPILNTEIKLIIFLVGAARDLLIFGLFFWLYRRGLALDYLRTLFFAILGFKSLCSVFSFRNLRQPIWRRQRPFNFYLTGAALGSLLLILLAIYWRPLQTVLSTVALDRAAWLLIVVVGLISLVMIEFIKYWFVGEAPSRTVLAAEKSE